MFVLTGNRESALDSTSRVNISPKLEAGVVFVSYFEPLYLKNDWRYQNNHGSIRSSSALLFLLFFGNDERSSRVLVPDFQLIVTRS